MNIDKLVRISRNATLNHNDLIPDVCPLTEAQRGIYFECLNKPDSDFFNIVYYSNLPDIVDIEHFVYSIQRTIADYPVFDTKIEVVHGVPSMVRIHPFLYPEMIEVECITADSLEEELDRVDCVFDLKNGPLYHIEVCECESQYYLIINVHHIISDGTSLKLLFNRIIDNYSGIDRPTEELTQFDVGIFENNCVIGEDSIKEAMDYYDDYLGGYDLDTKLIPDVVEETDDSIKLLMMEANDFFSLADMVDMRASKGITENAVFQGAFAYALSVMAGTNNCFYVTASHGRKDSRLKNSMGMYVETLPMYFEIDNEQSVDDYLKMVRKCYHDAKENDIISMSELVARYGFDTSIVFNYMSDILASSDLIKHINRDESFDINFELNKGETGYYLNVMYRSSLYSESFISNFASLFFIVVKEMLTCRKLGDICLTDDISRSILSEINMTEMPYRVDETVVSLFRKQVAATPNNTCLVCGDSRYTYAEVNKITDNLAGYLVGLGVSKEKVVAILINRSEYMLICALGVLKAGGAYLPLDPSYPADRLNLMVKDSGAVVLITETELSEIIDDKFKGPRLMTSDIPSLDEADVQILPEPRPEDLFVIIYTSGSTGVPKGVMFEHRNCMVTVEWEKNFYEIDETSKIAAYASFGFDANIYDIYPPIISGAELHIIEEEMRLDFPSLRKYFNNNDITHTVMTTQIGRQFASLGGLRTLKHLSVAGEKLTPLNPPTGFNLYNLYGPTEGSIITSYFLIDKYYNDVPIGKPVYNLKVYVVDKIGRLLPCGAVGELLIAGPHVTRGYLNRIDQTAEVYKENIYDKISHYGRTYSTGDIVRLNEDGNMQFIGRRDQQVKVRGYRIELTEVEEVVRRFPGIKDATIAAFNDTNGGKFLTAYVVSDDKVDVHALNDFIRSEKPSYMVPAVTMQIDKIPLNQNQKVNKKALPIPEREPEEIIASQTEMQQRLTNIVSSIIGHEEFGIDTNLFDAGLNSIGNVRLIVALDEEYNIPIKTTDIKANPTIEQLEDFINQHSDKSNAETTDSVDAVKKSSYPITDTQAGLITECMASPNQTAYNIPLLFKFDDSIEVPRLVNAIKEAFEAHYYLKTTFSVNDNGDICAIPSSEPATVNLSTFSTLPTKNELVRPFKLLNSPLYRVNIYETDKGKFLFMDIHHVICDGKSEVILLNDISRAYDGEKLIPEKYSGFEKAEDELNSKTSSDYEESSLYWNNLLSSCETECLPDKYPEPNPESKAGRIYIQGDKDYSELSSYCNKQGFTLNAYFNAVTGFLISKYSNMDSVTHATIYNGRSDSRLANSCTMAVRTIPVVSSICEEETVKDYIALIQNQLMESMSHEEVSFPELVAKYKVKSDIMLVYQGDDFEFNSFCNRKALIAPVEQSDIKAPISITVSINSDHFDYEMEYDSGLYSKEFARSFLEAFIKVSHEFAGSNTLRDVSLLSERSVALYSSLNDSELSICDIAVPNMIEEYASVYPDRNAVIANGKTLTYKELVDYAKVWSEVLVNEGVKEDTIVGFILERSVEAVIAELAIMMAGGAFLPIISSYPNERIEFCLTNSDSPIVITSADIIEKNQALFNDKSYKAITIEELYEKGTTSQLDKKEINPKSLAYCIYTSGSTGNPKGVLIEHASFTNAVQANAVLSDFLADENDEGCVAALSSFAFDMSIYEIYLALCSGKTSCIATDEEIHNPYLLRELFTNNNIRKMVCTPSFAMNIISLEGMDVVFKNLRTIVVGAEAFTPQLYDMLHEIAPELQILNGYGPTEATQCCAVKELTSSMGITIGKPVGNMKLYVVDKYMTILPEYAKGELIISGTSVGRGYVKLPDKTAASFVTMNGVPAYRSGDMVRLTADAEIDFCGRVDNQVKLRGYRVELDEIENVILTYDSIRQCKVIVRNNGTEDYLAGFYTSDKDVTPEELSDYMKQKLTYYMVPSVLMRLDEMPMTNSGKINKKALPDTSYTGMNGKRSRVGKDPQNSSEQHICDLFSKALGIDEIYTDDNFFELGGTSLTASKVTMVLMSEDIDVKYGDIFDYSTPEKLAAFIAKKNGEDSTSTIDYESTRPALQWNLPKYTSDVKRDSLGNVLLTGATGFLGIHVLKELIDNEDGQIYCLVRRGDYDNSEMRLKTMLIYYFSEGFEKELADRITIIDCDITDNIISEVLAPLKINTVINCAACVKHFADDDILERINVKGVEKLIDICVERNIKLIQISTVSVPGMHNDDTYARSVKMHENELFVVDDMANKYVRSKYQAELRIFDAIEQRKLRAKVIRVGNLMGRYSDGEFQANMETTMFISGIRGFYIMGKYPISHMTDPMRFSPIDCTARAVVMLAGTNDKFTAFNADSRYGFDEMKIIDACNKNGITIIPEDDEKYYEEFRAKLADDNINSGLNSLAAYDLVGVHAVETDNLFTTNILYRIGFSWPLIDDAYLERAIESLKTLGFFDVDVEGKE